jgi:predicted kinase
MTREMRILRGLPGCGKSTHAAELIKAEPDRWLRINRDDLRSMAVGPGNNPHIKNDKREALMRDLKNEAIKQAFQAGFDVILDDTHLVYQTVKKLHALAREIGDVKVIEKCFNLSAEECIERDKGRQGFALVGEKIIKDMARINKGKLEDREVYYPPRWSPGADHRMVAHDPKLPTTIISDLDGTLCLLNGRPPFNTADCHLDLPNEPVVECIEAMWERIIRSGPKDTPIIFTSGREDQYREPTIRFLQKHLDGLPYLLFMRKTGDSRKDAVVKREMYEEHIRGKFNIIFWLDDRSQVVDMARELGLTVFQVAPGNF